MNIQFQVCGLIIVILLLGVTANKKTIWLASKKTYAVALICTGMSIILDMVSIFAIINANGNYNMKIKVICRLYLLSLVFLGFIFNQYTIAELNVKSGFLRVYKLLQALFVVCMIALIAHTPIKFHYTGEHDLYTYGLSVTLTYIATAVFITTNLVMVTVNRKKMNVRRFKAIHMWMDLMIIAAVLQFLKNDLLIVGFASAVGVLIVFIKLENPESFIDRESGCFNEHAFNESLNQSYQKGELLSMLTIRFAAPHYLYERYDSEKISEFIKEFADTVDRIAEAPVFRYREWEFVVIFNRKVNFEEAVEKIKGELNRMWEIDGNYVDLELIYTKIPDSFVARDADGMIEMMRAFRRDFAYSSEKNLVLEEDWAVGYRKEQEVEEMITLAMKEDRVKVYYQPIYSTAKKKFISAEALVRIIDEDGNVIPPITFIPVAENTGLILELGKIVFEKACRLIVEKNLREKGIEYLEINLSAVQCMRTELADDLLNIIEKTGVDPKMLNLEITESMAIHSTDILLDNMNKLRVSGVCFSLDDFGTGYSNLDYLLELPIVIVKFDRKMTQAYFSDQKRKAVMGGVINMVKAAELEIVAEGVEEKEQLDELQKIDIDFIQGYYFSKPVPEEEFLKLIDGQVA